MNEPEDREAARLAALARYEVMDTPREASFDEIAALAARLCDAPIGIVNLIGDGRQFFKAEVGIGVRETPLDTSFCARAILEDEFLLIPDATRDSRFACNPLVTGEGGLRFYAGALLKTEEGFPIGTLCVLDRQPRQLTDLQQEAMRVLARQVMTQLELRRSLADRHRDYEAARASEERLRLIVDSARDYAIFTMDDDHRITSWSAGAETAFIWTEREAIGRSFEELFTPEDRAAGKPAEEIGRAIAEGRAPDVRWHLRADGSRVFMNGSTHPMVAGDGAIPRGFLKIARNETAQRRQADELAQTRADLVESEARFRALFTAIDDGFCIIEFFDGPHGPLSDYVHVEANPGYERHTGIAGIVGMTLRNLAPAEADEWAALYGEVLRTGAPVRFERYFELANRYIEVSAARVEPASRQQVSVLFRDITERRQAEESRRASEALAWENIQRVQLALSAGAIVGTWFWDLPNDRFTVDEGFAYAFGLNPDEGHDGFSLAQVVATVHPADQDALAAAINEAIGRGGAYAHQYRVRRTDGRYRWIEANGRVEHGPDGTPLSFPGVILDLEERRAVEAERDHAAAALRTLNETLEQRVAERTADLMEAEEKLRQSQKMEAVGQLTGGLAHDFNNLLTGISGSLEMMAIRIAQGRMGDVEKYNVAAQGAAKRAAALTHRLLAFSRRQTLDPKPTEPNRLIDGMIDLIQRTVGPEVDLRFVPADDLWATLVDPNQLENALLNLCINARDAMPDGGRLMIVTGNRTLDELTARAHELEAGRYVTVSVSDTGTGMTPAVIAKAFDPFFTTKPIGVGTGLGLSMIYGFTRQSGGHVRIYSEVGEGTTVCLYLPRYLGVVDRHEDAPDLAAAPRAEAGETVLVVDDEPSVRMLVTDVLEELGYTAIEAGDGAAGLAVLQSDVRIDLLVSDVGLPGGMNGRQMADAARIGRPDLKILFITGYAENAVVGDGNLAPGMHVMTKPFAMEALATRIRSLIEGV